MNLSYDRRIILDPLSRPTRVIFIIFTRVHSSFKISQNQFQVQRMTAYVKLQFCGSGREDHFRYISCCCCFVLEYTDNVHFVTWALPVHVILESCPIKRVIDPLGRPTVTAGRDNCFCTCRPYVRMSPLFKI